MIHVVKEGGELKWGFNFYPWHDKHNFGFRFKVHNKLAYMFRYSKQSQRLFYLKILAQEIPADWDQDASST